MTMRSILVLLAVVASVPAQIGNGEIGLLLSKPSGAVGVPCTRNVQCSPLPTTLVRGERVTVEVRGVPRSPYAVFVGLGVQRLCLALPGIRNELVIAAPIPIAAGTLDAQSFIRSCPQGLARVEFRVPGRAPAGAVVVFQGLGVSWDFSQPGGQIPTLTQSIVATIR